jgi:hypothetical protein
MANSEQRTRVVLKRLERFAATAACLMFMCGAVALAQTPPAPVDLTGTWTLDTFVSDNPGQVTAAIRTDLGQNRTDIFDPFPETRGRGTMGRRGQAQGRESSGSQSAPSADEQRAIDDVTASVRYPPLTLRVAQSGDAITFTDANGQSRSFAVNGKRQQQVFDTTHADCTARWEGPQLVVEIDLPKGRKMISTYGIAPTTRQLLLRISFERAPGQPAPFEIKYAYNRTQSSLNP